MRKITLAQINTIKRELDHWEGKISVAVVVKHVAKVLGLRSLSRGTFYNAMNEHPELSARLNAARERYRDSKTNTVTEGSGDKLLDEARATNRKLKNEIQSLKSEIQVLRDGYVRAAYNAYYEKVRIENLSMPVNSQDLEGTMKRADFRDKVAFLNHPLPRGKLK